MWQQYAEGGVAIKTTFGRMKDVVSQFPDEMHMGRVRYGNQDMAHYNRLQFLFTKEEAFSWENEMRIVLHSDDPVGGQARNYRETNFPHREPQDDLNPLHEWVHPDKRRRFKLKELVSAIAISPWATSDVRKEVEQNWAKIRGYNFPVDPEFNSPLIPTPEELAGYGRP